MATQRKKKPGYWVRLTRRTGDVQFWCVNSGKARALEIYEREVRRADSGDEVEWGTGDGK